MIKLKEGSKKTFFFYEEVSHFKIKVKEVEKRKNISTRHIKERYEDLNNLEVEFNQQERRLEEEIISLKTQLEEGKRTWEVIKIQMIKKEKECEKLEEEVVSLRVQVNKLNKNLKSSQVLEYILNCYRTCSDKSRIRYRQIHFEKGSRSMMKET